MLEHPSPTFYGNRISLAGNSTYRFYGLDSEEKFTKNKLKLGESWEYYDSLDTLTYKYDEYGFRNHHFLQDIHDKPYIVTIGCSHTMGTGIHHEDTYSYQLEKLAGIPVYNMGLGASSNEVSFFNLVWLLTNFNPPKIIVFQKTGIDRFPLISQNSITTFNGPWSNEETIGNFIVLSYMLEYNKTKSLMLESMLSQLTKSFGVSSYIIPIKMFLMLSANKSARDLEHGGKTFNKLLAEDIWSNISNI